MHLEVVAAEHHVLSADVKELYARSVEGDIGILPGHQPALIALDIGSVRVVDADDQRWTIAVHRGTLFVDRGNRTVVLADIAELASEIDVERARARRQKLLDDLRQYPDDSALKMSLRKQELRLEVAGQPA